MLSMVTGHGRATPLLWKTVASSTRKGNQRRYEYEVLCQSRGERREAAAWVGAGGARPGRRGRVRTDRRRHRLPGRRRPFRCVARRRTVLDVRNCPGERLLVLRNHDVHDIEPLRVARLRRKNADPMQQEDWPNQLDWRVSTERDLAAREVP